ncbi:hypothetical protein DPMN_177562 [Dreissena polymorpha]|uniref:Uncharacterized protein n=1 Tax=Dreissena polymorpha TaxID=45954 RepID=A0A9D4EAG3_DREPO|nr:hypothetical protein DPMN_177562 [Dreissena polymorpha]
MTPLAKSSFSLTANRSKGYTAAATEKTTYSPNVSDFVSTAMTTAGITTRPSSAVTHLGTPQPSSEDDIDI